MRESTANLREVKFLKWKKNGRESCIEKNI